MNRRFSVAACVAAGFVLLVATPFAAQEEQEPEAEPGSKLSVTAHGVGTDVVDHELRGEGDRFAEGSKVVFWTRVEGGEDGDRIRHVWYREGEEVISVGLSIGGSRWRTYSRKTLHAGSAGSWRVEALDAEDRVLAASDFTCVGRGNE